MASVSNFQTALEGVLVSQITAAATTATVTVKEINGTTPTWLTTAHRITIIQKSRTVTKVEVCSVAAGTTQSGSTVTLGTLTRGLPLDGTGFTGTGTAQVFSSGAKVIISWDAQAGRQTAFKDIANTFSATNTFTGQLDVDGGFKLPVFADTTARDAYYTAPEEGNMAVVTGTGEQVYFGGTWVTVNAAASGFATATAQGTVEVGVAADNAASTGAGGSGALVVVPTSLVVKTSAGAGDENKIPCLDSAGKLASGFIPTLATVPTGSLFMWGTDTAPTGYLLCYGQVVSQATYAALYAVIGHTFASDPGSGNFTLPDLRGRFPLGQDDMGGASANRVTDTDADTIGLADGAETVTLTDTQVPSQDINFKATNGADSAANMVSLNGDGYYFLSGEQSKAKVTYSTEGGGGAHNNMPPYLTLNYIIKT